MRIPARGRKSGRFAKLALIPAVGVLLAACTDTATRTLSTTDDAAPGLLPGEVVTTQGAEAASLYMPIFIIATVVFFLIEGLLIFMAVKFRRRSTGDDLPAQTHGNNKLEIVWTVIPALVVTAMFVVSSMVLVNVEAKSDEPAVVVDVTAYQFGWNFDYPEHGISIQTEEGADFKDVKVPVDVPVRFVLKSIPAPGQAEDQPPAGGVIHSFYVPAFFYKLDVIPGRINEFEVNIEKPGTYGGQCAEFCGFGHGEMYFSVTAMEQTEFDAWLETQINASGEGAS